MITLPPDVYDRMKASIDQHGIGAGYFYQGDIPCCWVGHEWIWSPHVVGHITTGQSDTAVLRANDALGIADTTARITWDQFAAAIGGIQRGTA